MPLDPQVKTLLDQLAASGAPPLSATTPAKAREQFDQMLAAFRREGEPVARVEDRLINGPEQQIKLRIYRPSGNGPFGALVFFHGGGWVLGGLDSHDALCRSITNKAGCVTIATDYRLAPEHKFPAAPEDCYEALQWTAENTAALNCDRSRIAVGGDSAGGNLAAVVALMARDRRGPKLANQTLIYPVIDASNDTPSHKENADGYLLTHADMIWFWGHYLASERDRGDPLACPSRAASLRGLPPAIVVTAQYDPLRDEGEAYAAKLKEAGVAVDCRRYDGAIHGFVSMNDVFDVGKKALADICDGLRNAMGK